MIIARTSGNRIEHTRLHERWFTFLPNFGEPTKAESLGIFESLGEGRLPPRSGTPRTRSSGEVVTYVREGSLLYEDSNQRSEVIRAGEFHRTTLGPEFHYQETNASTTNWAHVFQIWFTPKELSHPGHESKRFGSAERRHSLCLVASPDGREGSLTVHQDGFLYSAIMPRGRHLVHALPSHRKACLHVVEGVVRLANDVVLHTGDVALLTHERAVSFSSEEHAEVLLLDVDAGQEPNGADLIESVGMVDTLHNEPLPASH